MLHPVTIRLQNIQWSCSNGYAVCDVARLDEIHPFISGNKYFKLKYNLQKAIAENKGIITMGGAYSNHMAATAFACNKAGIKSIGLIRGEIPTPLNHTLSFCTQHQMQLISIKRDEFYRTSNAVMQLITQYHDDYFFVPEGGDNAEGEKGCTEILSHIPHAHTYTHIACAVGTGTTCRGLALSAAPHQTILAIPSLKIKKEEQEQFIKNHITVSSPASVNVLFDFAGKGYAQKDDILISFMNRFYNETKMPLDFVYTGKLMMAITTLFEQNYFSVDDRVLVLHTGGLQGNNSLPAGTLLY
ncbi:MAG: pyridoxal-phosphate dependent enzyme [Chitinophagaceae bacterium]|nr:pyridoxal-phosphate dependent enzyme [Chitinophagaceae bacterium]